MYIHVHVLVRDEKEGRKKYTCTYMYSVIVYECVSLLKLMIYM